MLGKIPEKKGIKKNDDGFWLLWGIFKEYIKQTIIIAELRKGNFHSGDICRLIKNQFCKKGSMRETDSNLNIF